MLANKKLVYAFELFVAGASYGLLVPIVKAATDAGLTVAGFLPTNYLACFLMSAAVVLVLRPKLPGAKGLLQLAALGVCASLTSSCYYRAVALLPSAVALTLLFQYVWVGVVIDCVARRKLPVRWTSIAIVVVVVGTLFAAGLFEGSTASLDPVGLACGLGSAVFYALFLLFSSRMKMQVATSVRNMMVGVGGFVTTVILNPAYFTTSLLDASVWPWAIALAFVGLIIPVGLIGLAAPHVSVGTVNIMSSSELPVGVLAAWVFMGDVPSSMALLGVVLVLVGILLAQVDPKRE